MLFALYPPGTFLLYLFRYVSDVTGKWVRARYVATPHDIAKGPTHWEIVGEPEIRRPIGYGYFSPFAHTPRPPPHDPPEDPPKEPVNDPPPWDPPPKEQPPEETTDVCPLERMLALYFLRRYVTWCARRRRFAVMDGAARLYRLLTRPN
jgi:hypothetical protein